MTEQVEKLALETCPWCSSNRLNLCDTDFDGRKAYAWGCTTRGCHGNIWALGYGLFETREDATSAWNHRTPPDDSVARIVAWLRGPAFGNRHPEDTAYARHIADAIERGDWK